jgi:histidinol dehydrogenase
MRILKLTEDTRKDILQNLLKRSPNNYGEFEGRVNAIIEEEPAEDGPREERG